jgi:hypothetical protein
MIYFATVSFAEVSQRVKPDDASAWNGFLGVGDSVLDPLPRETLGRLRQITQRTGGVGTPAQREEFALWVARSIAPRNIAGLADPARRNLYPVDFDALVHRHALLGMSRQEVVDALPRLRGMSPDPRLFSNAIDHRPRGVLET